MCIQAVSAAGASRPAPRAVAGDRTHTPSGRAALASETPVRRCVSDRTAKAVLAVHLSVALMRRQMAPRPAGATEAGADSSRRSALAADRASRRPGWRSCNSGTCCECSPKVSRAAESACSRSSCILLCRLYKGWSRWTSHPKDGDNARRPRNGRTARRQLRLYAATSGGEASSTHQSNLEFDL